MIIVLFGLKKNYYWELKTVTRTESVDSTDVADNIGDEANAKGRKSVTEYLYLKNGEEVRSYTYDTENRLIAVQDNKGLLMAALYDGDGNRMFTADRTEDTNAYQLFAKKICYLT